MILLPQETLESRETLEEYRARGGYAALEKVLNLPPEGILQEVARSGLQGRGGAAFPAARKWEAALAQAKRERYLVANGGEDEPGSFKDRYLMERRPHLLLEGAAIAARAIGARTMILYVNRTFEASHASLRAALEELEGARLLPEPLRVEIFAAPTEYVAGEDTALIEVIEGRPPRPRKKPPYPVESGYRGCPTLVHNVETLCNLPFLLREGANRYRTFGTQESPGTMLFYLNRDFCRPGVYELPFGTSLSHLVEELGGGLKSGRPIQAILPGGPSTAFLPASALKTPLTHRALREAGSLLGCGNVRLIPEGRCMVEVSLEIARFFARESCGQCPPCQMETHAFCTLLEKILAGEGNPALLGQAEKIAQFNRGKGDCSLIQMAAAPLLSALRHFGADFRAHIQGDGCPAAGV